MFISCYYCIFALNKMNKRKHGLFKLGFISYDYAITEGDKPIKCRALISTSLLEIKEVKNKKKD